jgi:hypothetical protein
MRRARAPRPPRLDRRSGRFAQELRLPEYRWPRGKTASAARTGILVQGHALTLPGYGYYVTWHGDHARRPLIEDFAEWLRSVVSAAQLPTPMSCLRKPCPAWPALV